MKYMLLIYGDEQALSETERQDCYKESTDLARQLHHNGQYVAANPLQPTAMATSVRVRDGKRLITDGPFAETREQLGGYFLIDAKNLDEALAITAVNPEIGKWLLPPCGIRKHAGAKPICPEGDRYCGVPAWRLEREEYERVI